MSNATLEDWLYQHAGLQIYVTVDQIKEISCLDFSTLTFCEKYQCSEAINQAWGAFHESEQSLVDSGKEAPYGYLWGSILDLIDSIGKNICKSRLEN